MFKENGDILKLDGQNHNQDDEIALEDVLCNNFSNLTISNLIDPLISIDYLVAPEFVENSLIDKQTPREIVPQPQPPSLIQSTPSRKNKFDNFFAHNEDCGYNSVAKKFRDSTENTIEDQDEPDNDNLFIYK